MSFPSRYRDPFEPPIVFASNRHMVSSKLHSVPLEDGDLNLSGLSHGTLQVCIIQSHGYKSDSRPGFNLDIMQSTLND